MQAQLLISCVRIYLQICVAAGSWNFAASFEFYRKPVRPRTSFGIQVEEDAFICEFAMPNEILSIRKHRDGTLVDREVLSEENYADLVERARSKVFFDYGSGVDDDRPILEFDLKLYTTKQLSWRSGTAESSRCAEIVGSHSEKADVFSDFIVNLYSTLDASGQDILSWRILNIGAADGVNGDPIAPLVFGLPNQFSGLYVTPVDAQAKQLQQNLKSTPKIEMHHGLMTPANAEEVLRKSAMFSGLRHSERQVDILKIDIDSYDCDVADAILSFVAKALIVIMEVNPIPPPVLFAQHFDTNVDNSHHFDLHWPLHGCSLSYQVEIMSQYGLFLHRYTGQDAVFIHSSIMPILGLETGMKGAMDEFECFTNSLIMQHRSIPIRYSQEWFFVLPALESLHYIHGNITAIAHSRGQHGSPTTLGFARFDFYDPQDFVDRYALDLDGNPFVTARGCDWRVLQRRARIGGTVPGEISLFKLKIHCCKMFEAWCWPFHTENGWTPASSLDNPTWNTCCLDDFFEMMENPPTWIVSEVDEALKVWDESRISVEELKASRLEDGRKHLVGHISYIDGKFESLPDAETTESGNDDALLGVFMQLHKLGLLPDRFDLLLSLRDVVFEDEETRGWIPVFSKQKEVHNKHAILIPHEYLMTPIGDRYGTLAELAQIHHPWENKIEQLFWRGSPSTQWYCNLFGDNCKRCFSVDNSSSRRPCDETDIYLNTPRPRFLQLAASFETLIDGKLSNIENLADLPYPEAKQLFEVLKSSKWLAPTATHSRDSIRSGTSDLDFFAYKYLWLDEHTDAGFYRMRGDSLIFQTIGSMTHWMFPRSPWFQPWEHYIPVAYSQSDLIKHLIWAMQHDQEARSIAAQGQARAKDLFGYQSVLAYVQRLITEYSKRLQY